MYNGEPSQLFRRRTAPPIRLAGLMLPVFLAVSGCASVPLKTGGTLTSYSNLGPSEGRLSKTRSYADAQGLASAKTARIMPSAFSTSAAAEVPLADDRMLIANALDRTLCIGLSDKYRMVPEGVPADLTVRSTVTDIVLTDKIMAGVSTVTTLGSSAVSPVGLPRIPIGLGGLAVEAEALDRDGVQRAAMIWSRGANSIQDSPRYSEIGDAYGLAAKFGDAFAELLVSGTESQGFSVSLPKGHEIKSWLGSKPKYVACDQFGRAAGIPGAIISQFGAPPQWTEKRP